MIEIPNFTVEKEIGRGGMALVYLAVQDMLSREVALKVLLPDMMKDENLRNSFLSEGKIIASLDHPNIVRIHDIGIIDDSIFYMSMEYLSGGTLKEKLADGKLSYDVAVGILEETSKGLSYAHGKGYIHRDIKPGNILFRDDGVAVLTDFGIAKLQDTSGDLTRLGFTLGTVQYMSPEQATTVNLDSRSDIYSLGLVFYEMLTGQKAFKAESNIQAIHQHTTVPPPELSSEFSFLQPVMNKVLAKDPDQRYQTAGEFVQAVKNAPQVAQYQAKAENTIHTDATVIHQIKPVEKTPEKKSSLNKRKKESSSSLLPIIISAVVLLGVVVFGLISYFSGDKSPDIALVQPQIVEVDKPESENSNRQAELDLQQKAQEIKDAELLKQQQAQVLKDKAAEEERLKQEALEKKYQEELALQQKLDEDKRLAEELEAKRLAEEAQRKKEAELAEAKAKEKAKKEAAEKQRNRAIEAAFAVKMPIEALNAHNKIRAEDNQKPFVWSQDLAQIAQQWADKLASTCEVYHHKGKDLPFGENLFFKKESTTITEAVNTWASEKKMYNYKKNRCQKGKECGHYTQIVWKGTTDVGCGVQSCSNGGQIWVCDYFPAGNYIGFRPF